MAELKVEHREEWAAADPSNCSSPQDSRAEAEDLADRWRGYEVENVRVVRREVVAVVGPWEDTDQEQSRG